MAYEATIPESQIINLTSDLALKANDNATIHLAGAETVSGVKTFSGGIIGLPAPVNPNDATSKTYVDTQISNTAAGITQKFTAVNLAATNVALTGLQTIDGVANVANDIVLLIGQTTSSQNGLWQVGTGAWIRPASFPSGGNAKGSYVYINSGTTYANSGFVLTGNATVTIDTTAEIWVQYQGTGQLLAGNGLTKTNNTINVNNTDAQSRVKIVSTATTYTPLTVQGIASQTGDLLQIQDSGSTVLANITAGGVLQARTIAATTSGVQTNTISAYSAATPVTITPNATNTQALVIRGVSSQTADIQQWQNTSGGIINRIKNDGTIVTGKSIFSVGTEYGYSLFTGYLTNELLNWTNRGGTLVASSTGGNITFNNLIGTITPGDGSQGVTLTFTAADTAIITFTGVSIDVPGRAVWTPFLTVRGGVFPNAIMAEYFGNDSVWHTFVNDTSPAYTGAVWTGPDFSVSQYPISGVRFTLTYTGTTNSYLGEFGLYSANTAFGKYNFLRSGYADTIYSQHTFVPASANQTPIIIKALASQTSSLQSWQNSSGTTISYVDPAGTFRQTSSAYGFHYNDSNNTVGRVVVYSDAVGTVPFIGRAIAGQTGDLLQMQNSSAAILAKIDSNGNVYTAQAFSNGGAALGASSNGSELKLLGSSFAHWSIINNAGTLQIGTTSLSSALGSTLTSYLSMNGTLTSHIGTFSATPLNASSIPLIVKGVTSQTADLQEWQNSAGTIVGTVNAAGRIGILTGAAPSIGGQIVDLAVNGYTSLGGLRVSGADTSNTIYQLSGNLVMSASAGAVQLTTNNLTRLSIDNNGQSTLSPNASSIGLIIKGASLQTADLNQLQDNNGISLSRFTSSGAHLSFGVGTQTHAALNAPTGVSITAPQAGGTLPIGTTQYYVVTAYNSVGETIQSLQVSGTPTSGNQTFTISWSQAGGATGYKVYRSITSGSYTSPSLLATISNGYTLSYIDTGTALSANAPPASTSGNKVVLQSWFSQNNNIFEFQNAAGTPTLVINNNGVPTWSGGSTSTIGALAPNSLLSPPFARVHHDRLRFVSPSLVEIAPTSSSQVWTTTGAPSIASVLAILAGRTDLGNLTLTQANPSARITWNSTGLAFANMDNLLFGFVYTSPTAASVTITWESSADGITWTQRGTANPVINAAWFGMPVTDHAGDAYFRLTLAAQSMPASGTTALSTFQALSGRPGNQGGGEQTNLPYLWDGAKNVTFTGLLQANNGSLTYPSSVSASAIIAKGLASQTGDLQQWQNSSGTVLAKIDSAGTATVAGIATTNANADSFGGAIILAANYSGARYSSAMLSVNTAAASNAGIVVRGQASQSGNLQEWQNSTGAVATRIGPDGTLVVNVPGTAAGFVASSALATTRTAINTLAPATLGLVVQAATSQTADLQQWQKSDSTVLSRIDANGNAYHPTLYQTGVRMVAASTTCVATDRTILVNSTGNTVTLPVVALGRIVTVKLLVAGSVTVTPASGLIDGQANYTISTQYMSVDFLSDGSNWYIV